MSRDMRQTLTPRTRRLLDIQGFDAVDVQEFAPVAPWLRLAFGLCALLAGAGTILASPTILLVLMPIAALAAAAPVHPSTSSTTTVSATLQGPVRCRGVECRPVSVAGWAPSCWWSRLGRSRPDTTSSATRSAACSHSWRFS
jgi:hypothetical protein